jgi:replicative DNA helicase
VRYKTGLVKLRKAGINEDFFEDEFKTVWLHLVKMERKHGKVPGKAMLLQRFPDLGLPRVKEEDASFIVDNLKNRRRWVTYYKHLEKALSNNKGWEQVDEMVHELQADLTRLSHTGNGDGYRESVVDMFSSESKKRIIKSVKARRDQTASAIPTGLTRFDVEAGGLYKSRLTVVIGRPGKGKSWLTLYAVANAVKNGATVLLYPLEMSFEETAYRLISIFSAITSNGRRIVRDQDLNLGRINLKRLRKVIDSLSSQFEGKLLLSDTSASYDPYTTERIESEVAFHKPDMAWVDYITLMKSGAKGAESWQQVAELSRGLKGIAMRQDIAMGCSAQVNRSAISQDKKGKQQVFLPRLENIAYGDSIAADANQVISIDRLGKYLYWSLVKNRNGPEISRTKVVFNVDQGMLLEAQQEDDDEE